MALLLQIMKIYIFLLFILQSLLFYSQNNKDKLSFNYDRHLYFNVFLENKSLNGNFVFDTGASSLYIDSLFYKKNNFSHKKLVKGIIDGIGANKRTVDVVLDSIIFNIEEISFNSNLTPLLDLRAILGEKADGIFGLDFFENKVIRIDYIEEEIGVSDSITDESLEDYQCISLIVEHNRFFINCKIWITDSTYVEGKFLIDTGMPDSLLLNKSTIDEKRIPQKIKYESFQGLGGQSYGYTFISKRLELGGFELTDIITDISIDSTGALANSGYIGIIGNGLLERFDIVFDGKNGSLYVKANKKFNAPFENPSLGFSYIKRSDIQKGWIVTSLYTDSPAAKSGLQNKDEIVRINNIHVNELKNDWLKVATNSKMRLNLEVRRKSKILNISFTPHKLLLKKYD